MNASLVRAEEWSGGVCEVRNQCILATRPDILFQKIINARRRDVNYMLDVIAR